jgi:hypothetical protein
LREQADVDFRVDVAGHAHQNIDLGLTERADEGARLAIEIDKVEGVEVGDVEAADAKTPASARPPTPPMPAMAIRLPRNIACSSRVSQPMLRAKAPP